MSSVLVWFLVNPRRYPGIISGKYPSSGRVCQLAASYLFCNYPDYLIDEFWAGFLPHSRRRGVSALHTFLIFGIKGIGGKSALLWAGLGSFSSAGCLEKGFKHTHKPPLFFSFFFLVHKPFLGCRDTQPGFGERRVKLSMLQNLLQVGIFLGRIHSHSLLPAPFPAHFYASRRGNEGRGWN